MSQTADTYFEKTIARFRKVLSPTVVPISLPGQFPAPPTSRPSPRYRPVLHSSHDVIKPPDERQRAKKHARKTVDHKEPRKSVTPAHESNSFTSDSTQGDKIKWKNSFFSAYPCEHHKRWSCAENCVHICRKPREPSCHCSQCRELACPARRGPERPADPGYPATALSDVATFMDTCTMTLQRANADAGASRELPPPVNSTTRGPSYTNQPAPERKPESLQPPQERAYVSHQSPLEKTTVPKPPPVTTSIVQPGPSPPGACHPSCSGPFIHNELNNMSEGTAREYIVVKCPTCQQTVTTPVDAGSNKYEFVSLHQKRFFIGIPVESDIGTSIMNSPLGAMLDSPDINPSVNYGLPQSPGPRLPPCECPCRPVAAAPGSRFTPLPGRRTRPNSPYASQPRPETGLPAGSIRPGDKKRDNGRLHKTTRPTDNVRTYEHVRGSSRYHEHCTEPDPLPALPLRRRAATRRRVVTSARPLRRPCPSGCFAN